MFFVEVHWMEFVSHVKFRQLQTQRLAYQNNTFSFATRLGWLATEFTSNFHKLYRVSPFAFFSQILPKGLRVIRAKIDPTSDVDKIFSKMYSQYEMSP
jgi:hypothetical protein